MFPDPSVPLELRPVQHASSSSSSKKAARRTPNSRDVEPTAKGKLRPEWIYHDSKDGENRNIMIMLHGAGDTERPFSDLAKQWSLPNTAILSLRVPLMDIPSFSYTPISPLHYLTPSPPPTPTPDQLEALHTQTIPLIRRVLKHLVQDCGYDASGIHLFGWGEGGTVALEVGNSIGKDSIGDNIRRIGSIISVSGELWSTPSVGTKESNFETPVFYFHRPRPSTTTPSSTTSTPEINHLRKIFSRVTSFSACYNPRIASQNEQGKDVSMPKTQDEWKRLMKFWSEVLLRGEMKMGGEVYEVVR